MMPGTKHTEIVREESASTEIAPPPPNKHEPDIARAESPFANAAMVGSGHV